MPIRLIAAWPLDRHEVWLSFSDGTEGAVDLSDQMPPQRFEALRDVREFRQVAIDRRNNMLRWPSGIDLETSGLYRELRLRIRHKQAPGHRRHGERGR